MCRIWSHWPLYVIHCVPVCVCVYLFCQQISILLNNCNPLAVWCFDTRNAIAIKSKTRVQRTSPNIISTRRSDAFLWHPSEKWNKNGLRCTAWNGVLIVWPFGSSCNCTQRRLVGICCTLLMFLSLSLSAHMPFICILYSFFPSCSASLLSSRCRQLMLLQTFDHRKRLPYISLLCANFSLSSIHFGYPI